MDILSDKRILEKIIEAPDKDVVDISASERTPKIYFNKNQGTIKLSGRAMPENARLFFGPLLEWIEKYVQSPQDKTFARFDLEYFNSSSSKIILNIFNELKKIKGAGKELHIEWHYMEEDDDCLESGKTFEELSELEFQF